jgi:2-polyprenyl-3-methyl-5-hydroxy-6-metoxy-1,4-benzoquinol methylase
VAAVQLSDAQRERMQKHEWFHALELGGGVTTCGRFPPGKPQNQTLFSVFDLLREIDVAGIDCLDIGATDGLISFGLEKLGAKSVLATDRVAGAGFLAVHELLASKVEHRVPVEISTILDDLSGRSFDLIVCAGVIYHMLNPLSAIMACRALLRPGGLLIVETAMSWSSDRAVLVLNSEEEESMESSTYWMPTPGALKGMTRLCHFDVLGGRWQRDIGRGAVLGRAAPVTAAVADATTLTRAMHEHGLLDYQFRRQLAAAETAPASRIAFKGDVRDAEIKSVAYVANFPFHAHSPDPETALGLRDWKDVTKT